MRSKRRELIGQLLVRKKLISRDELGRGLDEHRKSNCLLGEALMEMEAISQRSFYQTLSEQFGLDYINLQDISIKDESIDTISAEIARRHQVVPIKVSDSAVTVATSNPEDLITLDSIGFLAGRAIKIVVSTKDDITGAIRVHYAEK